METRRDYNQANSPALCAGNTCSKKAEICALIFRKGCSACPEYPDGFENIVVKDGDSWEEVKKTVEL